jgi:drug/metabolite transporter (DMT)-like permease
MTALGARAGALSAEAKGALLYLLAVFFLASMDAMSKELTTRYDTFQVIWARYLGQTVLVFLLAAPRLRTVLRTRFPKLQAARSALMFGATICGFSAFAVMPLADATAIFETAPLIVTALAALILREQVGPRRWTAVVVGFVGALVIVRPGASAFAPEALLPLGAASCYAGYAIATRYVGQDESPWTAFIYSALFGSIVASLFVPLVWTTPSAQDAGVMALLGLLGAAGHFCVILAFRATAASVLAPLSYFGLLFATVYGFAWFGDLPDLWTVSGALIIVGSGLYVWRRERVREGA